MSCPAKPGHPLIQKNFVIPDHPLFAGDFEKPTIREADAALSELCEIFATLCIFFESHRNPAPISIAMSPDDNNGGLHECTGDVLPPTGNSGQAVRSSSDRSVREGGVQRGCEPLARARGAHRMAQLDPARQPSRRWRERRSGAYRPQALGRAAAKDDPRQRLRGGNAKAITLQGEGPRSWILTTAGSSRASND